MAKIISLLLIFYSICFGALKFNSDFVIPGTVDGPRVYSFPYAPLLTDTWSMEFWIMFDRIEINNRFVYLVTPASGAGWNVRMSTIAAGTVLITEHYINMAWRIGTSAPIAVTTGRWYYMSMNRNDSTGFFEIYIDLVRVMNFHCPGDYSLMDGHDLLIIGTDGWMPNCHVRMDDFKYWRGRVRTMDQKRSAMSGRVIGDPGFDIRWFLDEGRGSFAADRSRRNLNGDVFIPSWVPGASITHSPMQMMMGFLRKLFWLPIGDAYAR